MQQLLTTEHVAPRQRVAFWQEMVSQTFVQAHCDSRIGEAFSGRIDTAAFAQTEISRIDAGQQCIDRRASDIARACKPRFYLCYQSAGRARVRERNREDVLVPGDLVLLDNCEPYSMEYQDRVTQLVLHVPQEMLRDRFRSPECLLGRRIDGARGGMARVAGEFLASCVAQADSMAPAQRPAIAGIALSLFTGVLAEAASGQADASTHQAILLARIKQHVLARLSDPTLDLHGVAAAMGVSVRYLSRLFQIDGRSFGRFLLQQRVERCRQDLADPALRRLRVSEIALRAGFNDFAHFSRAFRSAVGTSPSDYRGRLGSG